MSRVRGSVACARGLAVLAGCLAAVLTGAASPSRAAAVSGTPLPFLSGNSFLAVDPVGKHVFVSGGTGNSSIVILDFNGNIVKTITGENGASGMAVDTANDTLYVALQDNGQIAEIDTTTLTETARFSTGVDTAPYELAIAAGKLWVTGNNTMSVNLDGTGLAKSSIGGGPLIAASRDGNLLAFSDTGYSPASVSDYDVTTKTPTLISSPWDVNNSSNGEDISFDASGQSVLFASGAPYFTQVRSTTTLQPSGEYVSDNYPNAVAASPGGAYVAGGAWQPYAPDVYLFRTGSENAIASWSLGSGGYGSDYLSEHGLAFSPDGTKLFAVADGELFVLPNPDAADTHVSITTAPDNTTLATSASFGFSSPDNTVTFQCSLDGAPLTACTSPASYSALSGGLHTLQVQAIKGGSVVGSTGRTWMVESLDTTLSSGPNSTTYATSASFSFSSHDDNATFQCSLDNSDWAACTSPAAYTQLGIGSHTFSVRAVDGASTDATGASQTWTIQPPDTQLLSGPSDPTYSANATFKFWSHDGTATFQCSLDGAGWTACASPVTYTGLALGSHTFAARAVDDIGAPDPVGVSKTWLIVIPSSLTTQITDAPNSTTRRTTATFSFTTNDPTATFVCSIDSGALTPCTSPATYNGLAEGSHAFSVYAIEGASADATGATKTWNINLTAPPVAKLQAPSPAAAGSPVVLDASASHDAFDGTIVDYKWDLGSGSFKLDTGSTPTTTTTFATPGVEPVRVEVTNELGVTAIASAVVNVDLAPPPGNIGISINNGDYATNSPNVQLDVIWPLFAQNILISNDGGFGATGGTQTVPVAATIPWTLITGGSERLPHIVYARFPDSLNPTVTFSDDIILDTTTPVVTAASMAGTGGTASRSNAQHRSGTARTFKVKLVASEKLSGISQVQFAPIKTTSGVVTVVITRRNAPGIVKLTRTLAVSMAATPKWVRVRSAARNWSKWHAIRTG